MSSPGSRPLLAVEGLSAGYGRVQVLRDLSFAVPRGAVVALLGPNGAGKTTTLRVLSGTLAATGGAVRLDGERIDGQSPYAIARRGVTLVPEGRGVFPSLTVRENLAVAAHADRAAGGDARAAAVDRVLDTFPRLRERLDQPAGTMSGGEQQMLALSRAFLSDPRLLLLDEISMGLAPRVVVELYDNISRLREHGLTIVLVEQFLTFALELADLCYIMKRGRISFVGDPAELSGSGVAAAYFGR